MRIRWASPGFPGIRQDSLGFARIRSDSRGFVGLVVSREDSLGFARIPKYSRGLRLAHPPNERSARSKRGRGATSLMPSSRLSWSPVVSPQTFFISLRDSRARIRLSNKSTQEKYEMLISELSGL